LVWAMAALAISTVAGDSENEVEKTVCVTGVSGYLGSVLAARLIQKGYKVIGTARDPAAQLEFFPSEDSLLERGLTIVQADLLDQESFVEPFRNCSAVMHTASPFQLKVDDPKNDLIKPAVEGTRNVLRAAAKAKTVRKVVVTSSAAAVTDSPVPPSKRDHVYTEDDWQMDASLIHKPYRMSKRLAELEAWRFHMQTPDASAESLVDKGSYFSNDDNAVQVSVINPAFILGPPVLTRVSGESVLFMKRMIEGAFANGAPNFAFGVVDVRDVAQAHLHAMEMDIAKGHRFLMSSPRAVSPLELAQSLLSGVHERAIAHGTPEILEIAHHLAKVLPQPPPEGEEEETYRTLYDMRLCQNVLGVHNVDLQRTVTDMAVEMIRKGIAQISPTHTDL